MKEQQIFLSEENQNLKILNMKLTKKLKNYEEVVKMSKDNS